MSEQEIISKILEGQTWLFEEILNKYQKQIKAYTLRLLNFHEEDAKDAMSQAFIKAYINLAGYNPKLKFSSWLYRIAHNEAVNLIKKNSKSFTADSDFFDKPINLDFDKPQKSDLEAVLLRLKMDDKNLLTLFYLEGLSIKEISEMLKTSQGSVKTRLNRARNKAKEIVIKSY